MSLHPIDTSISTTSGVDIGSVLPPTDKGAHMCMIYSDEDERRATIAKYLKAGVINGECVGCFVNSMPSNSTPDWITKAIQDIPSGEQEGQLLVRKGEEAYCPDGTFVVDRMLGTLRDFCTDAIAQGFSGARVAGDAGFILKDISGSENFINYEAQINELMEDCPITALCQYDANRFDGAMLYEVLRVHPLIIINGQVVRNSAYQSPRPAVNQVDVSNSSETNK
jgi:hypothetical protein